MIFFVQNGFQTIFLTEVLFIEITQYRPYLTSRNMFGNTIKCYY